MADATVYGIDLNALMSVAFAQAQGSQKARYCSDIASLLGSNAIFRIKVSGTTKYQSTVVGALTSSSSGIAMPTQFVEPPSTNVADALTDASALIEVSNASNQTIYVTVPIKSSANAAFILASAALDGTKYVRTSGVLLTPPDSLDANVGGGSTTGIYLVDTLVDDQFTDNDNGWWLEAAQNTNPATAGIGRYAYVNIPLHVANSNSHYLFKYIDRDADTGLTNGSTLGRQPWYVIGRPQQVSTGYANIRVQMRRMKTQALLSDNSWVTLTESDALVSGLGGANWHANFRLGGANEDTETQTEVNLGALYQIRTHGSGEGGGESIGGVGFGDDGNYLPRRYKWAFHGYPYRDNQLVSTWKSYVGFVQTMEARLILHDTSGPDNRSASGLMIWFGADWYRPQGLWDEHLHGRLKEVQNDWALHSCSDIPEATLRAYPPPGFS